VICSVWEPTAGEREAIAPGANIELIVWGTGTPPVAMTTTDAPLGKPPAEREEPVGPVRVRGVVAVVLSRPAARFLRGFMRHVNDIKRLPPGGEALETAGLIEEITAKVAAALDGDES
jgi:hypothetical protein